jgi:hypothetical protein
MNRIWANRLEAGTKTWDECPASRKTAVDAILRQDVEDGKITQERYTEITGKPYESA